MSNSKLLKEAIADAKAVKATALANAKLALEEAFTPRLQSMLTQKLRKEAEMEDDADQVDEELDSSGIGTADTSGENPGKTPNLTADTELGDTEKETGAPGTELDDYTKSKEITEEEEFNFDNDKDAEIAELKRRLAELEGEEPVGDDEVPAELEGENDFEAGEEFGAGEQEAEDDDMDLEAIIRELEAQLGDDTAGEETDNEYSEEDPAVNPYIAEDMADGAEAGTDKGEDPKVVMTNEEADDDEVDLEEILREMETDLSGTVDTPSEKDKELGEAYKTIRSLRKTINEVNLLNAKLLFANKLFRAHNMTNEQKVKVIETLDRTKTVREVKLVFSTLAESFKYTSMNKPAKKSISEGLASKVVKSTKPAVKPQIINEATVMANRFQLLAGINKK